MATSKEHVMTPAMYRELRPQFLLAALGAVLVGLAYLVLPEKFVAVPGFVPLVVIGVVLAPLAYTIFLHPEPHRIHHLAHLLRLVLQTLLTLSLLSSLALYIALLPSYNQGGGLILRAAALLWVSNILIFASWYWEIDGNGPVKRHLHGHVASDFLFPQQSADMPFVPGFVDYLFLAFNFATALSPADTAPLTPRAKLLMMAEALISLTILVLLVARSVNIF
jgi:uncharacterized membrane protein